MGLNKPLGLFTETAQEEAILNGNEGMQSRITWEQNNRAVLKSCVPYLPSRVKMEKNLYIKYTYCLITAALSALQTTWTGKYEYFFNKIQCLLEEMKQQWKISWMDSLNMRYQQIHLPLLQDLNSYLIISVMGLNSPVDAQDMIKTLIKVFLLLSHPIPSCPVPSPLLPSPPLLTWQEAMSTSWNTKNPIWTAGKALSSPPCPCHEGDWAQEKVTQVTFGDIGDIKNPTGCGPEQPALVDCTLSRRSDWLMSRGAFPPQTVTVWRSLSNSFFIRHSECTHRFKCVSPLTNQLCQILWLISQETI